MNHVLLTAEQAQQIEEALVAIGSTLITLNFGKHLNEPHKEMWRVAKAKSSEALAIIRAARTQEQAKQEPYAPYGFCPICGRRGVSRERGLNGNDTCVTGHRYASSEAIPPEPVEPVKQEPVARVSGYYGGRCVIEPLNRATVLPTDMALYAATVQQVTRADLKAAFKEGFERAADLYAPKAEQEPYAYEVWDANDQVLTLIYASCLKEFYWIEQDDIARKLYAAPVRVQDLTDDEIYPLYPEGPMCDKDMIDFARAVIAADRKKNK